MKGVVDSSGRALLRIRLRHPITSTEAEFDAWIDTGFTGELVLSRQEVVSMGFPINSGVPAILADGSRVDLDTYTCFLDWFGEWKEVEIIANKGQTPLLGVGLLLERELQINYPAKTLSVV